MHTPFLSVSPKRQKSLKASLYGLAFFFISSSCAPALPTRYSPEVKSKVRLTDNRLFAQEDLADSVFSQVDEQASFPGGAVAFIDLIKSEQQTSSNSSRKAVVKAVFLSFVVKQNGGICNARISRGTGEPFDSEAVRILLKSAPWNPGQVDNQPVHCQVQMKLPIKVLSPHTF